MELGVEQDDVRCLRIERDILAANDELAQENRNCRYRPEAEVGELHPKADASSLFLHFEL